MIVNKQLAESIGVDQKDLWETPPHIFDKLNSEFKFTLDPCCTSETAKCETYITPCEDGLTADWGGHTVFCNPPYSRNNIDLWVRKCYEESLKKNTTVVALLPVSTSAKWWHEWIVGKCELRFVERRIKFIGAPNAAPFSSVVAVFGSKGVRSFNQERNSEQELINRSKPSVIFSDFRRHFVSVVKRSLQMNGRKIIITVSAD